MKMCKKHKPKKLDYLQWHAWAEKMIKKGEKQKYCKKCKHWFFKCEY